MTRDAVPDFLALGILDSLQAAVIGVEKAGRIAFASLAAARLLGYREDELVGLDVARALPGFAGHRTRTRKAAASPGGAAAGGHAVPDLTIRQKGGRTLQLDAHFHVWPQGGENGVAVELRESAADEVAAARASDLAVLNSPLLETAEIAIAVVANTEYVMVNKHFERLFGWPHGEWRGRPLDEQLRDHQRFLKFLRRVERSREPGHMFRGDFELERRDGTRFWCRARGKHIDSADASGGTVWVCEDITEAKTSVLALRSSRTELRQTIRDLELSKKRLQDRTNELMTLAMKYSNEKKRAQASEKSKSEFLASMSHEIRTPMSGVLGMTDLLLETQLDDHQCDFVMKIKGAGKLLQTIINDILDLSKMEAGKLEIEYIDFDLPDLVRETAGLLRGEAKDAGLRLECVLPDGLPRGVNGDPMRIRQILINLIGNAVKFTPAGTVSVEVEAGPLENGYHAVNFIVSDTGIGIPESARESLFDAFSQVDGTATRRYEGTGLGLAISRRLTELMGGEIGVESHEGVGSRFSFSLNLRPAETDVGSAAKPDQIVKYVALRPLKFLLAEDNALNQMIVTKLLGQFNHLIDVVDDGAKAVEAVRHDQYDVVLMDVRMPVMNGLDATRAIRQLSGEVSKVKIVAITADAMFERKKQCLDIGMDGFVAKPIDLSHLLSTINTVLAEEIHLKVYANEEPDAGGPPEYPAAGDGAVEPEAMGESVLALLETIENEAAPRQ